MRVSGVRVVPVWRGHSPARPVLPLQGFVACCFALGLDRQLGAFLGGSTAGATVLAQALCLLHLLRMLPESESETAAIILAKERRTDTNAAIPILPRLAMAEIIRVHAPSILAASLPRRTRAWLVLTDGQP